ncbi:MAG: hypothetical protein ACERKN_10915 [Velocimicrobium sp.]
MKIKKSTFIILTIIFCMSFVACERKNITEAPTAIISPTTGETKKSSVPIEDFYNIIRNEDGTYTVKLFDENKKVIDETTVPKEPHVNKLENDIIQITIYYGSPFYTSYFYDTKDNLISQAYDTPVLIDKGKIVLVQNKKLIVSDIFDKALYFKEIEGGRDNEE